MNDTGKAQVSSPASALLPDSQWSNLLKLMGEGKVIPVIGPELLRVPWDRPPLRQTGGP